MWENRLKRIIELLETSDVNEIEVSFWGRKFRVSKGNPDVENPGADSAPLTVTPAEPSSGKETAVEEPGPDAMEGEGDGVEIRAPMVGTFYRAPSPESSPYVEVGSHVSAGQTLCIIEAMKIMNEIESEITGKVSRILPENAQAVEYGQLLFLIEPD